MCGQCNKLVMVRTIGRPRQFCRPCAEQRSKDSRERSKRKVIGPKKTSEERSAINRRTALARHAKARATGFTGFSTWNKQSTANSTT